MNSGYEKPGKTAFSIPLKIVFMGPGFRRDDY